MPENGCSYAIPKYSSDWYKFNFFKKKTAVKWSNLEHRSPAEAYASVTRDNPFIDDNQMFQTRPKERCSITCKKCRDENFTFRKEALHVQMGWKGLSSLKTKSPKCAYLTD